MHNYKYMCTCKLRGKSGNFRSKVEATCVRPSAMSHGIRDVLLIGYLVYTCRWTIGGRLWSGRILAKFSC